MLQLSFLFYIPNRQRIALILDFFNTCFFFFSFQRTLPVLKTAFLSSTVTRQISMNLNALGLVVRGKGEAIVKCF